MTPSNGSLEPMDVRELCARGLLGLVEQQETDCRLVCERCAAFEPLQKDRGNGRWYHRAETGCGPCVAGAIRENMFLNRRPFQQVAP